MSCVYFAVGVLAIVLPVGSVYRSTADSHFIIQNHVVRD